MIPGFASGEQSVAEPCQRLAGAAASFCADDAGKSHGIALPGQHPARPVCTTRTPPRTAETLFAAPSSHLPFHIGTHGICQNYHNLYLHYPPCARVFPLENFQCRNLMEMSLFQLNENVTMGAGRRGGWWTGHGANDVTRRVFFAVGWRHGVFPHSHHSPGVFEGARFRPWTTKLRTVRACILDTKL